MSVKIYLTVRCDGTTTSKKLAAVLSPDNRTVPKDLAFAMGRKSRSLAFKIESPRTASAFSTLAGVLDDIVLFREVWLLARTGNA